MHSKNYTVCRDEIYVGQVVRTSNIYRSKIGEKDTKLEVGNYRLYRSILFVPDNIIVPEQKTIALDLLYNSPDYPILNVTEDDICLNLEKNSVVIKDAYNLSQLLQYFDYNKLLDYKDILEIRKKFFDGKFVYENCELFGMKEIFPEGLSFYSDGEEIIDPNELKRLRNEFKINQKLKDRTFTVLSESPLPKQCGEVLTKLSDGTIKNYTKHNDKKIDAFKPSKEEKVKKLSRF